MICETVFTTVFARHANDAPTAMEEAHCFLFVAFRLCWLEARQLPGSLCVRSLCRTSHAFLLRFMAEWEKYNSRYARPTLNDKIYTC